MADNDRVLVTGAGGCIGAWTIRQLVDEGTDVVALDVSDDVHRLRLLLNDDQLGQVRFRVGDIRDQAFVEEVVGSEAISHIVHLAALQVPFCIADPVLGSQVNVTGTVNILEAVRRSDGAVRGVSYASSIAVFGPAEMYPGGVADDDALPAPATLYGSYKQANEWTARVYAADWGIGSVGLRPSVVYGPGRDQGLTSDPTKAMLAAAAGTAGHIAFGGSAAFEHGQDVADCFIAAARIESATARVHNVGGPTLTIDAIANAIEAVAPGTRPTIEGDQLPLPPIIDGHGLSNLIEVRHRDVTEGIADTITAFRDLLDRGLIEP